MTDAIAQGNTSFQPTGQQTLDGCAVYTLTSMEQAHFYFRAGDRILWLAVAFDRAEPALRELLDYYASTSGSSGC